MSFNPYKTILPPDLQELPQTRLDLTATEQIYDRQPYWVVKDPMSLRYFRFSREEYFIIEQLGKGITLSELKEAHFQEFRGAPLSTDEIATFISQLTDRNLIAMRQADRDSILYRRHRRRWRLKLKAQFSNFMFFKIPLYDPDELFNRIIPHIRFFWSRMFFLFYLAMIAVAAFLVMRRWNDFAAMFHGSFFTLRNIPLLFISIWLIKGLHEFGHGLTCKNYGGEVHEMGWLFLVFAPFFYCNVTDSWTFTNKTRRMLVTAGGIMTEILCAALATFIWYFTDPPGLVHAISFNIIIACSISTVLFNANPLLKYDGYYMLMDLIEVPNLRARSSRYMTNLFVKYILGGHSEEMPEEHRFSFVFPLYSIAAYFYRWFIVVVILYIVYQMLEQLGLEWLGRVFVVFSALTMLIFPIAKGGNMIIKKRYALGISRVRLMFWIVLIVIVVGAVLFWPLQQHVTLPFILEPQQVHWIRSEAPGFLNWTSYVKEGVWLDEESGQATVATLQNDEIEYQRQEIQANLEQIRLQIAQYQMNPAGSRLVEQFEKRRNTLLYELDRINEQIADLEVVVPFSGELLLPDEQIRLLQGKYVERGEALMLLADTRRYQAKMWVPEKTWARIFKQPDQLNQPAQLMLFAFTKEEFSGRVIDFSSHREDSMGLLGEKLALSNKVGGEVLTEYDPVTRQEKPMEAVYEVTIALDEPGLSLPLRPYMSGRVQIDCGKSTMYRWCRDSILRFISPEIRL
ncbi:MAG: hypothetical protein GY869_01345 [Planctomycetes bacterium]|nr:hypothetical protein [Planctomycetota bacterium]